MIARDAGAGGNPSDTNVIHDYDEYYRQAADVGSPPWEIGRPQPAIAAVLDSGVKGPKALDIGCGTGDLAIALARRGYRVTAVDISSVAIEKARAKAAREGLTIDFQVQDATKLFLPSGPFDSMFDSGLLHNLNRLPGHEKDEYLALLPGLAAPGATIFVLAMSLEGDQPWGLTENQLRRGFAEPDWIRTEITKTEIAAAVNSRDLRLPAFLLRTVRAS